MLATTFTRLGLGRDPFPTWWLGLRAGATWLITTPVVTYLMHQMGFTEMVLNWFRGDDDEEAE
jgi:hypothetical protein